MQNAPRHTLHENGDYEIVSRIRQGDERAVSEMYGKYARYVAAIAYRLMGDDADLDDVVQDTFVSAVKSIGNINDATALKTWLATIAVRSTSRYAEARRKQKRLAEKQFFETPNTIAPQHDMGLEARQMMSQIPYKYKAPWILCKVMDMNLEEASNICECSVATSKRRIAKAENLIRRMRDDA